MPVNDRAAAKARSAWVDELEENYIVPTIALIEEATEDEVIRRLGGGDPSTSAQLTTQQAIELIARAHRENSMIGLGTLGASFGWELNT